ncbi:hypothetical protein NDU88_002250 [Pleurodeles waltl]|uniref:Myb/SANT-like DNA-binding domain-containing protein n=1 Tax=Pleurodeles waltl TaxID=8319 RepID=A0AAV7U9E0_PLEWA|nr:hypothetical protein NDU88_002250 [Pleurodeles waltl]
MATVSGERAPAFTVEELEKLVDGVVECHGWKRQGWGTGQHVRMVMVSAHQKKGIWRAIAKGVRTLGVYHRQSTHCRKRWEDLRRWSKKTGEAQLGMASQYGRGARRTMTPLMYRILAVAYPELDGRLRASQQPQGGLHDRNELRTLPIRTRICKCHEMITHTIADLNAKVYMREMNRALCRFEEEYANAMK